MKEEKRTTTQTHSIHSHYIYISETPTQLIIVCNFKSTRQSCSLTRIKWALMFSTHKNESLIDFWVKKYIYTTPFQFIYERTHVEFSNDKYLCDNFMRSLWFPRMCSYDRRYVYICPGYHICVAVNHDPIQT